MAQMTKDIQPLKFDALKKPIEFDIFNNPSWSFDTDTEYIDNLFNNALKPNAFYNESNMVIKTTRDENDTFSYVNSKI